MLSFKSALALAGLKKYPTSFHPALDQVLSKRLNTAKILDLVQWVKAGNSPELQNLGPLTLFTVSSVEWDRTDREPMTRNVNVINPKREKRSIANLHSTFKIKA